MKLNELSLTALTYLIFASIACVVVYKFNVADPGLTFVIGSIGGTSVAAMLYHRRIRTPTPAKVKATVGAILATLTLLTGLITQSMLSWMKYPDLTIIVSMVGSFFFPWFLFGTMLKSYQNKD